MGWSETAQLNWDPNPELNLSGYNIYYGMASRNYNQTMDVGPVVDYSVPGLLPGVIYYFSVTAYNSAGGESGFSNEVVFVPANTPVVTGPIASIDITPASAVLQAGFAQQYAAVAKDAQSIQLSGVEFNWTSSNPAVAAVSGTGLATGFTAGNAVITASSSGVVSHQSFLQVTAVPTDPFASEDDASSSLETGLDAIEVSPFSASIAEGSGQQFAAVVKDVQGNQLSDVNLTWLSSRPDIADIDATGRASAFSSGTTEIFAASGPVTSNRISLQVIRAQQSYNVSGGGCGFIQMRGGRLPDKRQIAINLMILFAPLLLRTLYKRGRQLVRMRREDWLELFGVWNGLRVTTVSLGVFLFAVMSQEVITFFSMAI